ncbi:Glycoside hydrolase-type carbohydrate-binding, subgroup [Phytophthora cactorum]|nr:Glycoside hydrolase-type carbohydrate-binding, subgroup [Phytophthora cactorum]
MLLSAVLGGVKETSFAPDATQQWRRCFQQVDAELSITAETDSIYYNAPSTLTVSTKGVNVADRTVVIEKSGFIGNGAAETKQDTDAVIWNPWVERSKTFKDFGAEEYINMLAVEPGRVSQKQALPAGQTEKNLVMSPPYILRLYLVLLSVLIAAVGSETYSAETTSLVPDDVDSGPFAKLHAKHARMLVHANVWGIMATTSVTFGGSAFANVVSYSVSLDGVGLAKEDATGTLFFYLSVDDFTGRVVPVKESQRNYAERVVFSKHPQMKHWPTHHDFRFYVLEIEHIVFLDFYGPAQHIPVSDYYKIKL